MSTAAVVVAEAAVVVVVASVAIEVRSVADTSIVPEDIERLPLCAKVADSVASSVSEVSVKVVAQVVEKMRDVVPDTDMSKVEDETALEEE